MLLYNQDRKLVEDIPKILYRGFDTHYKDKNTPIVEQVRRVFMDGKIYSKALLFKEKQIRVGYEWNEPIENEIDRFFANEREKKLKRYLTTLEAKRFNPSIIKHDLLSDHVQMAPTPFACTSDSLTIGAYYSHWIMKNPLYNPILIIYPENLAGIDMRRKGLIRSASLDREIAIFHSIPAHQVKGLIIHESHDIEPFKKLVEEIKKPLEIFRGRIKDGASRIERNFNETQMWEDVSDNIETEKISF